MASIDTVINWFASRQGKVTYSMENRNGPNSYDCSSSVYNALIEAGYFPKTQWVGNTDSEYGNLESRGWVQLGANAQGNFDTQRGDIFIWGVRGASGGAFGHTGVFNDADRIWNTRYTTTPNTAINLDNYDWLRKVNGYPVQTFYRYTGNNTPTPVSNDPSDQNLEVGSYVKFLDTFTVDNVEVIDGIWQVQTNVLCRAGFTWNDNGIPTEPLVEVGVDGYRTADQNLNVGALYKLPGKYQVLDLGYSDGMWLAQLEASGVKFWVDVATATEVSSSDSGTPSPTEAPAPTPPSEPDPTPTNPVDPTLPTVPINDPTTPDPVVTPPKEQEVPVVVPPVVTQPYWLTKLIEWIIKLIESIFKKK